MTQPDKPPYVFISHASGDVKAAREIVAKLHLHGVETWLAPDDVQPGREFSIQLEEAIAGCKAFVVLMSDKANASAFVRAETELAFGKRDIFPVRIADVQPAGGLALFLRLKHWTDAFGADREANLTRLAETINRMDSDEDDPSPLPPSSPLPRPQPLLIVPEPDPSLLPLSGDEAIRAYIGDKAPHFLEKWRRMDARGSVVSFSFPGFLFGPFWLLYRKVYKSGMIAGGIGLFFAVFATFGLVMHEKVIDVLVQLMSLAMAITIGVFGNRLYRSHVAAQTALHNKPGNDPQILRDKLAMNGGTSFAAALGLAVALVIANLLVFAFATSCCAPVPVPDPVPDPVVIPDPPPLPVPPPPPTLYSVCYVNETNFEIIFTINPGKNDSRQETLNAGQNTSYSTYLTADPDVRFDADASSSTNLILQTTVTASVPSADKCGNTYSFRSSGDTISLLKWTSQ